MENNPYLIAFDMDGTLLNKKKQISYKTKKYLKKLTRKGHKIVLASGRPSRAMKDYYDELNLSTPLICYNGAYTFSYKDKNFPNFEFQFPLETIKTLYQELIPYCKNVMCETDDEIWVDNEDKYLDKFFWYKGMNIYHGDISKILNKDPMTMIAQLKEVGKFENEIVKIVAKYPQIAVRFWTGSPYFELYFNKASKGASIKDIASYYKIDKDHIIAFGDAENDIEMFDVAGISIAMKNGKDSLKKWATHISLKDNNHNGIYYTLKAFFKGNLLS